MERIAAFVCVALVALAVITMPARAEPVLIGVAGPMSGPLAPYGAWMVEGVERCRRADPNERGGLAGRDVEIVIADDVADPSRVEAVADDLNRERRLRRDRAFHLWHLIDRGAALCRCRYPDADADGDRSIADRRMGAGTCFGLAPRGR